MYAEGQALLTYIGSIETYGRTVVVIKGNQVARWVRSWEFLLQKLQKEAFFNVFPLNSYTMVVSL